MWYSTEEHGRKEDGVAKMDEMDNCAFVRSHHSNATCLCFERGVHEKCEKHKMENKSMKWYLLVNSHAHTNAMKYVPSRKMDWL